jgi:membrane protein CcdC involved in cytochrome C biogenesis
MKKTQTELILLLAFVLLTRLPYLLSGVIPFSFDHGRDALAVLDIIKTGSLKFIGPWTSIPGLFFGPGWYYLIAPAYWISGGSPLGPVYLMLLLGLIQVWLARRYLGWEEAMIMATAPTWITLSRSAANPFPITLVSLLIIILLKKIKEANKISTKQTVALGFLLALGFHFSSALAVFYVLTVPLILVAQKRLPKIKAALLGGVAFLIPFIPQLLFEIKNKFIEAKSLLKYLAEPDPQTFRLDKIKYVFKATLHELGLAIMPEIKLGWLGRLVPWLAGGLLILGLIYMYRKKKPLNFLFESWLFLVIPLVGFFYLHFNVWYVYGLLPVAVVLTGQILRSSPKPVKLLYFCLLGLTPLSMLARFYLFEKASLEQKRDFLAIKLKVLNYIYQEANGQAFVSYQYEPEIYDYDWQYLYFWQAFKGKPLPAEFSYKPGEISYAPEKESLLKLFPKDERQPEKMFLILEVPENKVHYPIQQWLSEIKYKEIEKKIEFSPEVMVWETSWR